MKALTLSRSSLPLEARGPMLLHATALAGAGLALFLLVAILFDTVQAIVQLRSPFPSIDEWDNLAIYRQWIDGQIGAWKAFLAPNYEHRIALPRLVLFSDYRFFGGRGTLDLVVIFAVQGLQAAILAGLAWRAPAPQLGRVAIGAAIAGLILSLRQWHNFIWGFQVQFVGVYALASVSLLLFCKALAVRSRGGRAALLLAAGYAGAFAASFTMASGILVAPVMVALALLGRAGRSVLLLTAAVALACAAAYRIGLDIQPGYTVGEALSRLNQPARLAAFTAIDLGNLQDRSILAARWLGYGALAAAAAVLADAARRGAGPSARSALVGIMLFCLASAGMTAVGRLGYGMEQALSSRYATGTGLFWASALAYAWWAAAEAARPGRWRAAICAAGILFLGLSAWAGRDDHEAAESWTSLQRRAADLALTGLTRGSSDPDDGLTGLDVQIQFLRERRLSVFSLPEGGLAGRPITEAGPVVPSDGCRGAVSAATAIPEQADLGGVAVSGFGTHRRSGRVYIADGGGTIVGFASFATHPGQAWTWEGFARAPLGTRLAAYTRLRGGGLCRLGAATVSPARAP